MAKSRIEIEFNDFPSVNDVLSIRNSLSDIYLEETFVTTRTTNGETEISDLDISRNVFTYYEAIEADYNSGGLYTLSISGSVLTIEAVQDNVVFSEIENTADPSIVTTIYNDVADDSITIDSVTYSEADSDACNKVTVTVTTSELATTITSPVSVSSNVDNPFTFDWIRGQSISVACNTATASVSENYTLPSILAVDNITISKIGTPTGSSATILVSNVSGLTLQYSLDNITWQTSNIFPGLLEGDYDIYVKDQLGCSVNTSFEVTVFEPNITVYEAASYIDLSNSIRYKHNVEWDYFQTYKTIENTLSCEELVNPRFKVHKSYQLFQTNDIITTQLLSNYENISANVVNSDGSRDALTVTQKAQYTNLQDKRDGTYYAYSDTELGIYFTSGSIYDYDTEIVSGTYSLNGNLPVYGAVNNYVYVEGIGWFKINEIVYDESVDSNVLLVDYAYNGEPTIVKVSSIYNQQNYNVYEFEVNFFGYENKNIQIEVLQSDDTFGEYNYLSEILDIKAVHKNTMELIWYNNTDTRMFWSTGIKSKSRIKFEYFQNAPDTTTEVNKTDTSVILINSENYKTYKLEFVIRGTGLAEKMVIPPLHKYFYLNRLRYVANGEPEVENSAGTNVNTIVYNLTKSDDVFNAEFNGLNNISEEIIGLIQSSDKYLTLG